MADEPQAPVQPDTPEPSAPDAGTRAPEHGNTSGEVDYQQRYDDLRPEFDRKSQELSSLEQQLEQIGGRELVDALADPDTREEALLWLNEQQGWEVEEADEEEPDYDEEDVEPVLQDPRVDQLLELEHERQLTEFEQNLEAHVEEIAMSREHELPPALRDLVVDRIVLYQEDPETAYEFVTAPYLQRDEQAVEAYRDSKRPRSAPPTPGESGEPSVPHSDKESRIAHAMQMAEQAFQSQ